MCSRCGIGHRFAGGDALRATDRRSATPCPTTSRRYAPSATGALAICAGSILISSAALPSWLGWWAVVAGVGSVLARAVWTEDAAFAPLAVFWIWTAVISVWLIRGGLTNADAMRSTPRSVTG